MILFTSLEASTHVVIFPEKIEIVFLSIFVTCVGRASVFSTLGGTTLTVNIEPICSAHYISGKKGIED